MTLTSGASYAGPVTEDSSSNYGGSVRARLLFRRQFILGPRFIEDLPSWRRIRIADSLCLTAHPDLRIHQAAQETSSITLLGYVLDPNEPQAGDAEIVQGLLRALCTRGRFADLLERTHDLAGRWILIVNDGQRIRIVNDACGYRQVFYTDAAYSADLWCASQPGLIAAALRLEPDAEAMDFIQSYAASGRDWWPGKEHWWPGDSSAYREIKHLVPNHYLDMTTGVPQRFWPDRRLGRLSLEEGVQRNAKILRGVMTSASNRFPLALSLTAGKDSRLVLAASRSISSDLYCFTMIYWDMNEQHADVTIPSRLLARLGLEHHVIPCPTKMDPVFGEIYRKNTTTAHEAYGPIAQGLYHHYPQERVCVKGSAMHIVGSRRAFRLRELTRGVVDGRALVKMGRIVEHPFALRAAERWLSGAREISDFDVLDLFYWENKEGSWQASSQTEWDIVQEVLGPYNCRTFLANAFAVDEKYRRRPMGRFHRELIVALWPEVLSEPINPHKGPQRKRPLRAMVKDLLLTTRLYRYLPPPSRRRRTQP